MGFNFTTCFKSEYSQNCLDVLQWFRYDDILLEMHAEFYYWEAV